MHVLVTGAAGFLGQRLVAALLAGADGLSPVSRLTAVDRQACPIADPRVESRVGSITDDDFVATLFDRDVDVVCHLAAVLSGESESDFDLGLAVNVTATRALLEACRRRASTPRLVFASTIAVFGGPLPEVVPEDMALRPQSSYGTGKAIAELLVSEYTRRGFIDGVICRLATVTVRPGAPNSAVSSFVSGIIREPLAGVPSVCPVPLDTRLWVSSPTTVTRNLVHACRPAVLEADWNRAVTLPGLSTTARQMLDSLERLGGASARALVGCEVDPRISRLVCGWPGAFDVSRALRLGFVADAHIDDIVNEYRHASMQQT